MIMRRLATLLGVLALLVGVGAAGAAPADDVVPVQRLDCRLMGGAWEPCTLRLDSDGMGWQLTIGSRPSLRFLHDGLGHVRMQGGPQGWRAVEARWLADASLCWDGVCARGAIPLD